MKRLNKSNKILPDALILARCQREPWLFGILVDRYQNLFLRKSRAIVHSPDLAEDVVQEVFLKIYKNADKFQEMPGASFKSWAYKVLLNTSYTQYAEQKREQARINYLDSYDMDKISSAEEAENNSERRALVKSILAHMPSSVARLLRLYFIEGKSQKEIALIEHTSPGALRVRMYRAKKYFRDNLKTQSSPQDFYI